MIILLIIEVLYERVEKLLGKTKVFSRVFHRKSQQKDLKRFFPLQPPEKRGFPLYLTQYVYYYTVSKLYYHNDSSFQIEFSNLFKCKTLSSLIRSAHTLVINRKSIFFIKLQQYLWLLDYYLVYMPCFYNKKSLWLWFSLAALFPQAEICIKEKFNVVVIQVPILAISIAKQSTNDYQFNIGMQVL